MTDKKVSPSQEQLDMDVMAEVELSRLQRQYRIMEGDRHAYTQETNSKFCKQKKLINTLQKEYESLMAELSIANSAEKKRTEGVLVRKLQKLVDKHQDLTERVKAQDKNIKELDYQITKIQKNTQDLKSKQLTDRLWQARITDGKKLVAALENRLETQTKKFCAVLAKNKDLREKIDHQLKEREQFNKLWEQLVSKLAVGKKYMIDLIEQATIAYDQREEWCSKLQMLRTKAHNDTISHGQEMRQMEREIDHDSKLQEFLAIKAQKRVMNELLAKMAKKKQKNNETLSKIYEQYKEILDQIKECCNETDIDKLEGIFLKQEEENFALFNYINEINHELEGLSDTIGQLRVSIDEQRQINAKRSERQDDKLSTLEAKLETVTREADSEEELLQRSSDFLEDLLRGIEFLFQMVQCDSTPMLNLLGDNTKINHFNMLLYLGLLEKKVTELVSNILYKEHVSPKQKTPKSAREKCIVERDINLTTPCPLCMENDACPDTVDIVHKPKTREEVKEFLVELLSIPGKKAVHTLSDCNMPKSRTIMQRRYQ